MTFVRPHTADLMMQDALDVDVRLRFMEIDGTTRALLEGFAPVLDVHLPAIVDELYVHMRQFPQVNSLFSSGERQTHARNMQVEHWRRLFSGRFDEEYMRSVRQIGLVHSRIGLAPRWYVGAYSFAASRVLQLVPTLISGMTRRSRMRQAELLKALNQAVLLDMELAISVYEEENARRYHEKLVALGSEFEDSVGAAVRRVHGLSDDIATATGRMGDVADQATEQVVGITAAVDQIHGAVEPVATAAEELNASTREIAAQVKRTTDVAASAARQAADAQDLMQGLDETAQAIGTIVGMITDIASQTNLLALNATIEAARAGSAGKGFAVVANEVKNLAGQTARSTEEIVRQVDQIQARTGQARDAMADISQVIHDLEEASTSILAAVDQQAAATQEIARSMAGIAEGTAEVTRITMSSEDSGALLRETAGRTRDLGGEVDSLRDHATRFVTAIAAE